MKVRFRTRFTPPITVDLSSGSARNDEGSDVSKNPAVVAIQPELSLVTGVRLVDDSAVVAPAGRPGDWRPWALGAAAVAALGLWAVVRLLGK